MTGIYKWHKTVHIFISSILLLWSTRSLAQYENVWAFGMAGIDFNTTPANILNTAYFLGEGCASICDQDGRLLFYTEGSKVWNKYHELMPNGDNLTQLLPTSVPPGTVTSSTFQAAVIVPMPNDATKYYIFSLTSSTGGVEYGKEGRLYYSIVDMTLNGGKGDVVDTGKGRFIDSNFTEEMIAVAGNNCDAWLVLTPKFTGNSIIKSFRIDVNGIDKNPVISNISKPYNTASNFAVASSNRKKIAMSVSGGILLYDFDPYSGILKDEPLFIQNDSNSNRHGGSSLCFSPDNNKLYAVFIAPNGVNYKYYILQYDLSSGDSTTIVQSKTLIAQPHFCHSIKLAPDGKIYGTAIDTLSVIEFPDLPGSACNFTQSNLVCDIPLSHFPNTVPVLKASSFSYTIQLAAYCKDSILLTPQSTQGKDYRWQDGRTDTTWKVYEADTYWVSYRIGSSCVLDEYHIDTFVVVRDTAIRNVNITKYEEICVGDTLLLNPFILSGTRYQWQDGSTAHQRIIDQPGIYRVSYQVDSLCQYHVDSFVVTHPEKDYKVSFNVQPFVCVQDTVVFRNTSDPHFNRYQWSLDSNTVSLQEHALHIYTHPGSYKIILIGSKDGKCLDTTYQQIVVDDIADTRFSKDKDSTCIGLPVTFSHQIDETLIKSLKWEFGDGSSMYNPDTITRHAYDIAGIMPVTIQVSFRGCPAQDYSDTIYVSPLPVLYLTIDSSICWNGKPLVLRNLYDQTEGVYSHKWNTGDTTAILEVNHPGNYSLIVQSSLGCISTATVRIHKDCYIDIPNAFSPNGDGLNDYFFPRQLLSRNIISFRMQIFNRFGQLIFETTKLQGRGWDGRYNGQHQPQGVYVYLIEVGYGNNINEQYQGSITLME